MVEKSRMIVEAGGTLIVDGGKLTNMCDELWDGIEVRGSAYEAQDEPGAQGLVRLLHGAVVENAIVGVETVKKTWEMGGEWNCLPNTTGGIIQSEPGTKFINCKTAIKFNPYPLDPHIESDNLSFFHNTEFIVNDDYLPLNQSFNFENYDLSNKFEYHVFLNGVSGIDIMGCSFKNEFNYLGGFDSYGLKGEGIHAINADFKVGSYEQYFSVFSDLDYGIHASSAFTTDEFISIRECEFRKNITGIYSSLPYNQSSPIEILFNNFDITPDFVSDHQHSTGIYMDNTTDFIIEENTFIGGYVDQIGGDQNYKTYYGIVIHNSGPNENRLYNNNLEHLTEGIRTQNSNRSENGLLGLSIRCNDFSICEYDIMVLAEMPITSTDGIKENQGNSGSETTAPAGNTFYLTANPSVNDIRNNINNVYYWHHIDSANVNKVIPESYSEQHVFPSFDENAPPSFNKQESCPPDTTLLEELSGIQARTVLNNLSEESNLLNASLNSLVDNGDTEAMNQQVQTSWPEETMEVRAELLAASPYLSDTVMISAAQKEDVLPNAILTEVLVANAQSAKSGAVITAVDSRDTLLSQFQFNQVMQGLDSINDMEVLKSNLASILSKRERSLKHLMLAWKSDSTIIGSDSVISLLQNENHLSSRYTLMSEYLNRGDTALAKQVYQNIPVGFDLSSVESTNWQYFEAWLTYQTEQKRQDVLFSEPDSIQLGYLSQALSNTKSTTNAIFRNFLVAYDTLTYKEPYLPVDTTMKSSKVKLRPLPSKQEYQSIRVYPNPASDYVIVDYSGSGLNDQLIEITIFSASGKLVQRTSTNASSGFSVLNTVDLISGMYLVRLSNGKKTLGSSKLTIIN
jgi:hypothetical protein